MAKIKFEKKLEKELNELQKRCTTRTITMQIIQKELDLIEEAFLYQHTKKEMEGLSIRYDFNAQEFPSAYKYTPESTILNASYNKSGWI